VAEIFANRVPLVTGGSRGIGRASAMKLARHGANVAISYTARARDAEQVVAESSFMTGETLSASGGRVTLP
jgi:NAD(P)-dependent dehydrogenase (short-subunit alcohol dehydrogenase family)